MKAVVLRVLVDEDDQMAEHVVRYAIHGIEPSLERVSKSVTVTTEQVESEAE